MAKVTRKRLDELQREYDNLMVEEQRLADAVEQATKSLEWFEDATNHATQAEKDAGYKSVVIDLSNHFLSKLK